MATTAQETGEGLHEPSRLPIVGLLILVAAGTSLGVLAAMRAQDRRSAEEDERVMREMGNDDGAMTPRIPFDPYPAGEPQAPVVLGDDSQAVWLDGPAAELADDAWILAWERDGEARAWPLRLLRDPRYSVLNETLGELPVAATWCEASRTAALYLRQPEFRESTGGVMPSDRVVTLFRSADEWRGSGLMLDVEERAPWSQFLGASLSSAHRGDYLRALPTLVTTWGEWRRRFPETRVRRVAPDESLRSPAELPANWLGGEQMLSISGRSTGAWPYEELRIAHVVTAELGMRSVMVWCDPTTGTAAGYNLRGRDSNVFGWEDGQFVDELTGSAWDLWKGEAISGPLQGQRLGRVAVLPVLTETWMRLQAMP